MIARLLVAALVLGGAPAVEATTELSVFAYHDVVDDRSQPEYDTITVGELARVFDWLRREGYRVVSIDDVLAAHRGERPLPPRAVLLSFDDGYASFYTRVLPLLQAFDYPAVFAIVGSWIEPPEGAALAGGPPRARFVSWDELREIHRSGRVEIASHSYALHTTVLANVEGSQYPAAVARAYGRRGSRITIGRGAYPETAQPRFGDVTQLLASPYSRFVELAGRLVGAIADYAYDSRSGRYETDAEYAARIRDDLGRNSRLIEARIGVRPRVMVWPYGRYNEVAAEAARAEGMAIGLSLDPERADARELWRIARYYEAENPDLKLIAGILERTPDVPLLRGLCLSLDELNAPTPEERDARLGRAIDLVAAFRPNVLLLGAAAADGGVYFPNDRRPVRADLFGRALWQFRTRAGVGVYAELPLAVAGDTAETALPMYEGLAKAVPFDGLSLGPGFLAGHLVPGSPDSIGRWDPRAPRRARAGQDPARLPEPGRLALSAIRTVSRYQPAALVLDTVRLEALRPASEVALDAVDYLAVRWDGDPREAIRTLRAKGWLDAPRPRRLVYASARSEPAVWQTVQRAGLPHGIYCSERLLDRPEVLTALRPVLGAADYPYRPR
jgi:poly-beta-1,6-N-acetyl-D-glucosamine N-deacetylase